MRETRLLLSLAQLVWQTQRKEEIQCIAVGQAPGPFYTSWTRRRREGKGTPNPPRYIDESAGAGAVAGAGAGAGVGVGGALADGTALAGGGEDAAGAVSVVEDQTEDQQSLARLFPTTRWLKAGLIFSCRGVLQQLMIQKTAQLVHPRLVDLTQTLGLEKARTR